MQICITLNIPEKLKKIVDNIRYHYDRKLIKENYQYIHIVSPVESFINLKILEKNFFYLFKTQKRIRIATNIISYISQDLPKIFLNIDTVETIKEIYDIIVGKVYELKDSTFFPHIILAQNHSQEETEYIYENIKKLNISESFFSDSIGVYIKNKAWEKLFSYEL